MDTNSFKSRKELSDCIWNKLLKDLRNKDLSSALNSLLSSYEKNIITNRLAASILIKDGKSYKEIGRELWLSPTTIRSLKRTLENNHVKEYISYRNFKNKKEKSKKIEIIIPENHPIIDWIDHYASVFPQKTGGRRWEFYRSSRLKKW